MLGFLLFFLITVFLIVKLNEILGMEIGFRIEKSRFVSPEPGESTISEVDSKLSVVQKAFPRFNEKDFLDKAQKAFEVIFNAYAVEDVGTLRELLTPRIFQAFSMAIRDRQARNEKLEGSLIRFINVNIMDTSLVSGNVCITVQFVTEQSNILKNSQGEILEGNSDFVETHTDVWVFSRNQSSTDPRWFLQEIKSEDIK